MFFFPKSFILPIQLLLRVNKGILGLQIDKTWNTKYFVAP